MSSIGGDTTVLLFSDGGAPLPPLTETGKIDRNASGMDEFRRLMHQLLLVEADRNRFVYTPAGEVCDGMAPDGMPGLEGSVAFLFKWPCGDSHDGKVPTFRDAIDRTRASPSLKHWVLVTPWDLTPPGTEWLRNLRRRSGLPLHHWGQARIEQLLRQCP